MKRCALFVLFTTVILAGCSKDISGSYLSSDKTTVCWLQLVRTPDNHITGQITLSHINSDGGIEQKSATLTGAVNGENVTLETKGFLGISNLTLSGTFNRSSITLAGAEMPPGTLKRADLGDYEVLLQEQNKHAQAIMSQKAQLESRRKALNEEQSFEAEVGQTIARMQRFDSEADVHLERFPNAERAYHTITGKIREYVTREEQLVGNPNASNFRVELVNAATQESFATEQMHFQTQSLESSFQANIVPLAFQENRLEQGCNQYSPERVNPEPTQGEITSHRNECNQLLSAEPIFHQKYKALVAGLNQLEVVYKNESAAQRSLLAKAERLE